MDKDNNNKDNNNNDNNNNNNNNNNENKNENKKKEKEPKVEEKKPSKFKSMKDNIKNKISGFRKGVESKVVSPLTENIGLLILGLTVFLLLIIVIFFSSNYKTSRTLNLLNSYQRYQSLKSYYFRKTSSNEILGNHYIASSFNSCNVKRGLFSYLSLDVFINILRSGARYIEVKIFNNKFGDKNTQPIINNGLEEGEWKLCLNDIMFEDFCIAIKTHAFTYKKRLETNKEEGVLNPDDPLILSLDLKTRNNIFTLDETAKIINRHLSEYLLPAQYRNSAGNLFDTPMSELKKKLIILSSPGYEGSMLGGIVNGNWGPDGNILRYTAKEIDLMSENEKMTVKERVKKQLTIIVPEDINKEMDLNIFKSQNYDIKPLFDMGCQFISIYYQGGDLSSDEYITKFRNVSFITKPLVLRKEYMEPEIKDEKETKEKATYAIYKKKLQEAADYLSKIKE